MIAALFNTSLCLLFRKLLWYTFFIRNRLESGSFMVYIAVLGGLLLIAGVLQGKNHWKNNKIYKENIRKYQKKHELTDSELNLLKETLGEAKALILRWEAANKGSKELASVEAKEGGLKSAKEIFQELMEHPQKMHQLNAFLYIKLPEIVEASERVKQIRETSLSTKQIEASVKSMVQTIEVISASITDDYEAIIQEDSEEIALAKKIIGDK
ncbi:5-bromo-4-chloroindolyl phosphate hydrolysis family protein [Enterococcus gallinarum]|uniref:5-bromo-4-chloroindolyl phosphate hydrolysis family protein n=1 Tax=Enterococcus gallinarum TaxID=1353 RepID=UPI00288F1D87|nr:5-bromo-4-chloroindolyl phosphate hydrolysis family protein [Enterococcus gallinarum]MDT2680021.1 5-bromo-4-chloroindolyl phosphate hydrolysis family protein [Enterococcus gallinarum]